MLDLENLVALIPIIHLSKLRSVRLKGSSVYCLWKKKPSKSRLGQHDLLLWVIWSRLIWRSQTFWGKSVKSLAYVSEAKCVQCMQSQFWDSHSYLSPPPPTHPLLFWPLFCPPCPIQALPCRILPLFSVALAAGHEVEGGTYSEPAGGTNLAPPGFSHHTTSRNFPD